MTRLTGILCWSITFLGVLPVVAQVPFDVSSNRGRVALAITTCFGRPISGARILVRSTASANLPVMAVNGNDVRLPYGRYEVTVAAPEFVTSTDSIVVDEPDRTIAICLNLEGPEGITLPMRAEVLAPLGEDKHPCPSAVVSPILRSNKEPPTLYLIVNGRFVVEGLPAGKYFVALVDGERICSTHAIALRAARNQIVKLQ